MTDPKQEEGGSETEEDDQTVDQTADPQFLDDIGKCCFCGDECNPCSQSCGRCARSVSLAAIGVAPLHPAVKLPTMQQ